MHVDTGASVSLVSEETFQKLGGKERSSQLQSSKVKLRTYTEYLSDQFNHGQSSEQWTGRTLATLGCWWKWVQLIGQGLAVQAEARLDNFQTPQGVQDILDRHAQVFQSVRYSLSKQQIAWSCRHSLLYLRQMNMHGSYT